MLDWIRLVLEPEPISGTLGVNIYQVGTLGCYRAPCAHTLTHSWGNLVSPVHLPPCFWEVWGNLRTRRKFTGEHEKRWTDGNPALELLPPAKYFQKYILYEDDFPPRWRLFLINSQTRLCVLAPKYLSVSRQQFWIWWCWGGEYKENLMLYSSWEGQGKY